MPKTVLHAVKVILSWVMAPITVGTRKPVAPPENVLLTPNSVPAKFGERSEKLEKCPADKAPFKNCPKH